MKCELCGYENSPESKFCGGCAASLAVLEPEALPAGPPRDVGVLQSVYGPVPAPRALRWIAISGFFLFLCLMGTYWALPIASGYSRFTGISPQAVGAFAHGVWSYWQHVFEGIFSLPPDYGQRPVTWLGSECSRL